jgi:hypothetical protein
MSRNPMDDRNRFAPFFGDKAMAWWAKAHPIFG